MSASSSSADMPDIPILHVCLTCRRGGPAMDRPPGAQLYDRLLALTDAEKVQDPALIPAAEIRGVECLASCDRGCTAAIAMKGRWTWLMGHLGPEKAEDILTYARLYAASKKGTVMPSRRPAALSDMVLGRVPACLYEREDEQS
ncbi:MULTISPECIES: DUF1636 family protein [Acetobacter]|uniref:DUF1636 domain-containing protein n=1 Tax=Acetobacter thailandicus TaxID=1502842 RepID=A0ABT3QEG9_9PROT|nr:MULTISPECIES: DUF1636 domain-containing protein [Acetobacter]MBS0986748.1 DUF1636 domain-containing protein [Acetobacter thailandicus]MCX2563687.1 DUF1636 domain-containing protein [Acetobacter thailandicus]OUI87829.1 hypothetical protein HK11_09465 [Acetobacter sp. DmW_043]OUJ10299.1 hypothetical protein HK25_06930 [Acetobacter sp. DsW_059]